MLPFLALAQKEDKKLKALIEKETKNFRGDIGIYVHHLKKNTDSIYGKNPRP